MVCFDILLLPEFGIPSCVVDNGGHRSWSSATAQISRRKHLPTRSSHKDVIANWILLWSSCRKGIEPTTHHYSFENFNPILSNNFLSSFIQGTPILQGISTDCQYEFEWATNIMCPMHVAEFHKNTCAIYNSQAQQSIDLKSIFQNGIVTVSKFIYSIPITLHAYYSMIGMSRMCMHISWFAQFFSNPSAKLQQPTHWRGSM